MRFKAIIFTLSFFTISSVYAQRYHGVNTAQIESTGSTQTTVLTSRQWVCAYNHQGNMLEMYAKMAGFGQNVSPVEKAILRDDFIYEANQVIRVEVDLSPLSIAGLTSFETPDVSLPGKIFFNERKVNLQIQAKNLRFNGETLEMEISMETSLKDFGLSTLKEHHTQFSDQIKLTIEPAVLKKR